jgi:hypothetical protein
MTGSGHPIRMPRRLAVTHFRADVYKTPGERRAVQDEFEKIFPGLIAATGDLTQKILKRRFSR